MATAAASLESAFTKQTGRESTFSRVLSILPSINQEVWLVLSILALTIALNFTFASQRMVLGFYALPTLFAAYVYGRRHAVLTALASALVVGFLMTVKHPSRPLVNLPVDDRWFDLFVWAGVLIVTAYAMGTLYQLREAHVRELRDTYQGLLMILQSLVSTDQNGQHHAERVAVYATAIASAAGLQPHRVEDVRTAALLHEIVSMESVRPLLERAAQFATRDFVEYSSRARCLGVDVMRPTGGTLPRVLPVITAFHSCMTSTEASSRATRSIEAEILKIADVYDSLTSDRPHRKGVSPFDARTVVMKGEGIDFAPHAVSAFLRAFDRRQLEVGDSPRGEFRYVTL